MVTEAVGHGLDQGRPAPASGALDSFGCGDVNGEDVVAVDLYPRNAIRVGLLGERFGGRLLVERHRDRPLVVLNDEDRLGAQDPGAVKALVEIALGGRTVAAKRHRHRVLVAKLE